MTNPKPFWVVICSVCGKRVNIETSYIDDDGDAVHDECGVRPRPYISAITRNQTVAPLARVDLTLQ